MRSLHGRYCARRTVALAREDEPNGRGMIVSRGDVGIDDGPRLVKERSPSCV